MVSQQMNSTGFKLDSKHQCGGSQWSITSVSKDLFRPSHDVVHRHTPIHVREKRYFLKGGYLKAKKKVLKRQGLVVASETPAKVSTRCHPHPLLPVSEIPNRTEASREPSDCLQLIW